MLQFSNKIHFLSYSLAFVILSLHKKQEENVSVNYWIWSKAEETSKRKVFCLISSQHKARKKMREREKQVNDLNFFYGFHDITDVDVSFENRKSFSQSFWLNA